MKIQKVFRPHIYRFACRRGKETYKFISSHINLIPSGIYILRTWQFDAVIGREVYILCFMHSLSTMMILKHQQRKEAGSPLEEENAGRSAAFPQRSVGRISGSHNFTIYAISCSVPPGRKIGRSIWVGAKLLSTAKTSPPPDSTS